MSEKQKKYHQTARGVATRQRYLATEKGRAMRERQVRKGYASGAAGRYFSKAFS